MKNKKPLFAIAGITALAVISVTTAYYINSVVLPNDFKAADYQAETTESFVSPSDWKPCDVTPKTISVKNKNSNINVTVRIKFEDYWKDRNGNDIPDLTSNGQKLTSINFHDGYENYWELNSEGWYVYKTALAPGASTTPLIDSVSLSCDANLAGTVSYSDDGKSAVTADSPYTNAKFHVKATVITSQIAE